MAPQYMKYLNLSENVHKSSISGTVCGFAVRNSGDSATVRLWHPEMRTISNMTAV